MWHMFWLAESSKRNVPLTNASKNFYFDWGTKIPMRDGVHLGELIFADPIHH